MIQAHIMDAWTRAADRPTAAYRYLDIVNGFAAPMFLWLAGVALVLAGERALLKTGSRRAAWHSLVCRGLEVFVLAFLFRFQSFLFSLGGTPLGIFRVDILNIMGAAMAVAAVVWGVATQRSRQVAVFAATAVAIALLAPIVEAAHWVDAMPIWIQWHLRPAGPHTVFTLFPWVGFVFGGAAVGSLLTLGADARSRSRLQVILAAVGVALVVLGLYTSTLPAVYARSSFWTTSPTFFAVRVGVLLLLCSGLHGLAVLAARTGIRCRLLSDLGRASLFAYWVHVPVVYGWVTWPFHRRLPLAWALVATVVASAALWALIPVRDRLVQAWFGRKQAGTAPGKVADAVAAPL